MFDRAKAIRIIEEALDHQPTCVVCGRPTGIRDVGGSLFLSCPAIGAEGGVFARIRSAILAHTDRLILDAGEAAAA